MLPIYPSLFEKNRRINRLIIWNFLEAIFFSFPMLKLQETEKKQKESGEKKGNIQAVFHSGTQIGVAVNLWGYDHHPCLPPFCLPAIVHLPFFKRVILSQKLRFFSFSRKILLSCFILTRSKERRKCKEGM